MVLFIDKNKLLFALLMPGRIIKYQLSIEKHDRENSLRNIDRLVLIEETMNRYKYKSIVDNHMLSLASHSMLQELLFQHDNNSNHSIHFIEKPSYSYNLNLFFFISHSREFI